MRRTIISEIRELTGTDGVAMGADAYGIHALAAPVFDEYGICASLALIATNEVLPLDAGSGTAPLAGGGSARPADAAH